MPRVARIKEQAGIYHVMLRSISEILLFRSSEDKSKFKELLRKYKLIYHYEIYAYCLMSNHAHLVIDSCGADISTIMKSINQSYAAYYNNKYSRHGHVFQDRFKSKLVTNHKYLIRLTAYIHNNVKDIEEYKSQIEKYAFSSLGVYLGTKKDTFPLVNANFVLSQFSSKLKTSRKVYLNLMSRVTNLHCDIDIEFSEEGYECINDRKIILRNFSPTDVKTFISKYANKLFSINLTNIHENNELKALFVLITRSLCNYTFKDICSLLGNTSSTNAQKLFKNGYALISTSNKYLSIIDDFVTEYSVS